MTRSALGSAGRWLLRVMDWAALILVVGAAAILLTRFAMPGASSALPSPDVAQAERRHEFLRMAWEGRWVGPDDAPVVMVVYSNYGCGFCAKRYGALTVLRRRYPQHFSYVVKHFVDAEDRQMFVPAMAAECAGDQGRFEAFHRVAFDHPDVLRNHDGWRTVGHAAGVEDWPAFVKCVNTRGHSVRVLEQYAEGRELGFSGTPGIVFEDSRYLGAMQVTHLDSLIGSRLRSRED